MEANCVVCLQHTDSLLEISGYLWCTFERARLENGQEARIVKMDFSKTFDRVNYHGILDKLCTACINSSTSFCLRSGSWRTALSIHFQPNRPLTIWMFFLVTLMLSYSTFYYETDHRKCEIMLGGWHCGLRFFKLGRSLHTEFEPRSLAWLACSTGQSATTYTTVEVLCFLYCRSVYEIDHITYGGRLSE